MSPDIPPLTCPPSSDSDSHHHRRVSPYRNGGLHNALDAASLPNLRRVGVLGSPVDHLDQEERDTISQEFSSALNEYIVWDADDATMAEAYDRFCKQALYPLMHYSLPEYPTSLGWEKSAWKAYVCLNQCFADYIATLYKEGDTIWVNDYHLMLLPQMLRKRIPDATIAYFLHVPFPSSEVFRCLHVRRQLLDGLLGADLISLQTYSYARHFVHTCGRLLHAETTPTSVRVGDKVVAVGMHPIGIDVPSLEAKLSQEAVKTTAQSLRDKYAGYRVVVGRDKLDASKGVKQKFEAFETFLEMYPEWVGKVVFIQIGLINSSGAENLVARPVSDLAQRINARFGDLTYRPVVFLHQDIAFEQYLALLTVADAFMVTSVRDGMNLTCHEFIVAQKDTGHAPLLVSEFVGTYGSFGASLRLNPWDRQETARTLHGALCMTDPGERLRHWGPCWEYVRKHTAKYWVTSIMDEVGRVHDEVSRRWSVSLPLLHLSKEEWDRAERRVIFLRYDGSLAGFGKEPSWRGDEERIHRVLTRLTSDPRNKTWVSSGRTRRELEERLDHIPNLGLCAENGGFMRLPRSKESEEEGEKEREWNKPVQEILDYYTVRTPGSFYETKELSMSWHWRGADNPAFGAWQAGELMNHIEDALSPNYPIHAVMQNYAVDIGPKSVRRGRALERDIKHAVTSIAASSGQGQDPKVLALIIGDARSDDGIFRKTEEIVTKANAYRPILGAYTCGVGGRSASARYFLPTVKDVLEQLEALLGLGEDVGKDQS
ncbi:MAG: glycosyltransferase family 20-domain-containing protein [Piptocephalis tieghemiana]|nr:MAG: glycosyltransferase family 20-domain-containing protein [Piptocephalis tieghemiana]